jgi:hypothetical protein
MDCNTLEIMEEKIKEKIAKLEIELKQLEANYNAATGALMILKQLLEVEEVK